MTPTPPHVKHSYKVTGQHQHTELTPDGKLTKSFTVHLEHHVGAPEPVKTTVELPESHYTAENVHALASAQNEDIAAVAALPESAPPADR